MEQETKINPLSIKGKYYVDHEDCLDHECCVDEAPNIFKMDRNTWGAYVYKQPETEEEIAQCQRAIEICPVEAIHDDGDE